MIKAQVELVYGPGTALAEVRQRWTYDPAYSAFITPEIDLDQDGELSGEELAAFARKQVEGLSQYGYFTAVTIDGKALDRPGAATAAMQKDGLGQLMIEISLRFGTEGPPSHLVVVEVSDPNFFAYITMPENPVRLSGAPAGCSVTAHGPEPIDLKRPRDVPAVFWQALDGSSSAARQFVNTVAVTCP